MNRTERRRTNAPAAQKGTDRRRLILYGTLGLIAVLIVAGIVWGSRAPQLASEAPTLAKLNIGQDAPSFSVSTTAGPFSVPNASKKPVLLEVFATWCPHCQRETAVLNKIYSRYGNRVDVVAVSGSEYGMNENSKESQADVYAFTQKFKAQYPIAFDPELNVMKKYLQGGYPTVVIIGSDNKIRNIHDGEITEKTLSTDLDSALKA
jgi:thiol-disulfide isomerase/thioredoxin